MKDNEAREQIKELADILENLKDCYIRQCKKCGHDTLMHFERVYIKEKVDVLINRRPETWRQELRVMDRIDGYRCLTCGTLWKPVEKTEDEEIKPEK